MNFGILRVKSCRQRQARHEGVVKLVWLTEIIIKILMGVKARYKQFVMEVCRAKSMIEVSMKMRMTRRDGGVRDNANKKKRLSILEPHILSRPPAKISFIQLCSIRIQYYRRVLLNTGCVSIRDKKDIIHEGVWTSDNTNAVGLLDTWSKASRAKPVEYV